MNEENCSEMRERGILRLLAGQVDHSQTTPSAAVSFFGCDAMVLLDKKKQNFRLMHQRLFIYLRRTFLDNFPWHWF